MPPCATCDQHVQSLAKLSERSRERSANGFLQFTISTLCYSCRQRLRCMGSIVKVVGGFEFDMKNVFHYGTAEVLCHNSLLLLTIPDCTSVRATRLKCRLDIFIHDRQISVTNHTVCCVVSRPIRIPRQG